MFFIEFPYRQEVLMPITDLKVSRALEILVEARDQGKSALGMDKARIFEPLELLMRKTGCSRQTANMWVRELEARGGVTLYKEGQGSRIESLAIRRDSVEDGEPQNERGKERLLRSLQKRKRLSLAQLGYFVVLAQDFHFVQRDARVDAVHSYRLIRQLEQDRAVKILKKPNGRIDCLRLADPAFAPA